MTHTALAGIAFIAGLLVGSFLNVVIARVPAGLSIVRPGSRCPRCGHALAWYENVPLVSWLVLGGRCRSCRSPISARYPLVELLTGGLFAACAVRFPPGWELVRAVLFVGFLVPLALIDLEHWVLPFQLTLPGAGVGLLSALPLGTEAVVEAAIGAAVGFVFFLALEVGLRILLKKEALGAGDKWLVLLVGAFLGWRPLFGVLLLSNVQGALVGGVLLLTRGRAGPASPPPGAPATEDGWTPGATHVPFGPFIALAALELFFLAPWLAETFPGPFVGLITGMPWAPP
ncbi:MAG: prepilin peptidase [Myxococcaceae bacterium]|nr:MAG: prepilin peptidase [Myxococcaceae bacterium]